MPFVVLAEQGVLLLLATSRLPEKPVFLTGPDGPIEWDTFNSVDHWQRNGQRCWTLVPAKEHHLWWSEREVYLTVSDDGQAVRLADHPAPPEEAAQEMALCPQRKLTTACNGRSAGAASTWVTPSAKVTVMLRPASPVN